MKLKEFELLFVPGQGSCWECPGDSCGILDTHI